MVMVLFDALRRWSHAAAGLAAAGLSIADAARGGSDGGESRRWIAPRRVGPRVPALARRHAARPLTPFDVVAGAAAGAVAGAPAGAMSGAAAPGRSRPAAARVIAAAVKVGAAPARRFWITLDPQDRRHAALGGSFAEVCAALEQLAALEDARR